jgi:hypothetical protein
MKLSRTSAALSVFAACLTAGLMALPASADYGGPLPTFKHLFNEAVQKVRANPTFKRAVMLEVDGYTKNRQPVRRARGIVRVRFVFNNQGTPNSKFASAFLRFGPPPKLFGSVHGVTEPFLEDRQIPHAPKMSLQHAVKDLRHAGFHQRFTDVTLRKPLEQGKTHPLYIFGLGKKGQKFVAVDTVTHTVQPIS